MTTTLRTPGIGVLALLFLALPFEATIADDTP